jgi:hypothetical protein
MYYVRLRHQRGVKSPVWASNDASLHGSHRGAVLLVMDDVPPADYQIGIDHDPARELWSTLIEAWANEPELADSLELALRGLRAVVHRTAIAAHRGDDAAFGWCARHLTSTESLWPRLEAADACEGAKSGDYESADVSCLFWTEDILEEWIDRAIEIERRHSNNAAAAMFEGAVAVINAIFVPLEPSGLKRIRVPVQVPHFGWRQPEDHHRAVKAVVDAGLFGVLAQQIAMVYGSTAPHNEDPIILARAVANDTTANIPQIWREQLKLVEKPYKHGILEEHPMVMLARRVTEDAVRGVCKPWPTHPMA